MLRQNDYQWIYQLRYERDVLAQMASLESLVKYPGPPTRNVLLETLENKTCFYRLVVITCLCMIFWFIISFIDTTDFIIPRFHDTSVFIEVSATFILFAAFGRKVRLVW